MPKVYRTLTVDIETGTIIFEDSFDWDGAWELCDRSLTKAGKNAASTASATGANLGSTASEIGSSIIPGLESEAANPTGYTPVEKGQQLVAGEQGSGGATSGVTGQANLEAARTRNAGGFGGALDEAERIKGRQLSQNALNVENKSSDLAQKKQQFAQGELGGLYGMDTKASLEAMGLVPQDINAATNSEKVGWMQDFNDIMNDLKLGAQGAAAGRVAAG